jgi:solute carrier family 8 (sodium/calcium exchanger)
VRNLTHSVSDVATCNRLADVCRDGLILPAWRPIGNQTTFDMVGRAIVYGLSLAYMFLGVSIISDRFMSAIEVITSQEKEIQVRDSTGNKQVVMVRIWNETVSNLTVS